MERWQQQRQQAPPSHRHARNNPSFSSSLLDAICRSMDDSGTATPCLVPSSTDKNCPLPPPPPAILRRLGDPADDRRHRRFFSATSSANCSSIVGFSSVDFDSTIRPRPVLTRSNPIRIDAPPSPEKKRSGRSIRSRIRDLQKSPTSASPGARLAALVNGIFAGIGDRTPNKSKFAGRVEDPVNSSASFYARSGTSKSTAAAAAAAAPTCQSRGNQQTFRFSPVSIVLAEELRPTRPCGCGDQAASRDPQRMVELLRGFENIEDQEDCESVSSSDLFELDSLSVFGRFTDELPVYESSNGGNSRAIAHGFVV